MITKGEKPFKDWPKADLIAFAEIWDAKVDRLEDHISDLYTLGESIEAQLKAATERADRAERWAKLWKRCAKTLRELVPEYFTVEQLDASLYKQACRERREFRDQKEKAERERDALME